MLTESPPDHPLFRDDDLARRALEVLRWPHGAICAHCQSAEVSQVVGTKRSHREGLYACRACRKQFTVTVGTVFERSKVPLGKWLQVIHLENTAGRKPLASSQMAERCGLAHKTVERMRVRIYAAIDAYDGPNTVFCHAITVRIAATRPRPPELVGVGSRLIGRKRWYSWRAKNPLGDEIHSTGALSSMGASDLKRVDSTEILLRLLLGTEKPTQRIAPRLAPPKRRRKIVVPAA